ncbi:MAG TPA: SAM-dependent methyltransferase [Pirellulales bacterium]|nr:SAM-dependent methyltransferase [Pirellulales bacterium]
MAEPVFVFSCEPEWEGILADELERVFPHSLAQRIDDGWVAIAPDAAAAAPVPVVAFASQCLPCAPAIAADSIAQWVQAAGSRFIESLADHDGPWRFHIFGVYRPGGSVGPRRAKLIENGIVELLQKKQRRLLRTLSPAAGQFALGEALVQIGLVTRTTGYVSVSLPETLHALRRCVSPFPGGIVEVPPDRNAPSRAFAKLLEAEIRLGRQIAAGETSVDLGSSPGSWAYVALNRGAKVIAVDRTPLRADLMKHPGLTFVRGDAFRFEPSEPVDWLLCDVIAFPDRVFELLERWLTNHWCRQFCATIKFRGADEYRKLEPIKAWLAAIGVEFQLRRLTNNKNEVTAVGTCE